MSAPHLIHQGLKLINILKTPINTGKAHVGHFVQLAQFAHDHFTQAGGGDFSVAQVEEFFFDALDGVVDLFGADRAFAQGQVERGDELGALVVDTAAVFFDDEGEVEVWPLVGGETLFAGRALAAPADEATVFRLTRFHHLGVGM